MIATAHAGEAAGPAPAPTKPRSGGPRTPEGKERSRRNALKHGLRAEVLLPDDLAKLVERRNAEMTEEWKPETPYQAWLVGQAARASAQLDRCAELSLADLRRLIDRADDPALWAADRRLDAEALGETLAKAPGRVAEALERTPQGADWLIRRWRGLAEAARKHGRWDDPRRKLALDLLGVPAEFRSDCDELPADATAADLIALAEERIAELEDDKATVLANLDDAERSMAVLGMPLHEDAPSARLRRYEASCRRALHWALSELRRLRPEPAKASKPGPRRVPATPHPATLSLPVRLPSFGFADRDEAPAPARPIPSPSPAPASSPAPTSSRPLNRQARRAQERLARQAAKRAARSSSMAR